ncbi:hypothetical protein CCR75_009740 [Bremia lactucae]|uniref:Mur ligase central domain-containing protein n=1 Tax=Bremia lactucae TaxID=4779 RepID=A0A976FN93_BRELC|nr:hypothetical protein CCR75_009740 [Bremia lactucae]
MAFRQQNAKFRRWPWFRAYTVFTHARFRQAPAPAAYARFEPLQLLNSSVLSTPVGSKSLLDGSRSLSQRPALENITKNTIENDVNSAVRVDSATYEMLLQRLYQVNQFTAVKDGLENMQRLNAAFGDPASQLRVVHVAGTNGKGSVTYKVAKVLERSGYKTGLYMSPHIASFRERVQINGQFISERDVCNLLSEIFTISAQLRIPATFFEMTTMLAFIYFAKQGVDYVALETGLGGRLDSTNIVTPALSVITSIGLDHMRVLGNTREAIAREKAGIIKPHVPVVVGPHTPLNVIMEFATQNNAPLVHVPIQTGFDDDYNAENTAIAREACVQLNALHAVETGKPCGIEKSIELTNEHIIAALESRPPCRFQVLHVLRPNSNERKVTVVLDVAHNPQGIDKLIGLLYKRFPDQKFRFVCGFSADKAIDKVLEKIMNVVRDTNPKASDKELQTFIHLVKANHVRGASLDDINRALANASAQGENFYEFTEMLSISKGLETALARSRASKDKEVVVVCGSVFLMAEARQALGYKEPIDSVALNDGKSVDLSTFQNQLLVAQHKATIAAVL